MQRLERFLHAVGREDIETVCEIAGPAAKQAEDEGWGPCEQTYRISFAMFSAAQKVALRTATVRSELVVRRGPQEIYVPTQAVRASVAFTERDIGDFVLSYRGNAWFIVD